MPTGIAARDRDTEQKGQRAPGTHAGAPLRELGKRRRLNGRQPQAWKLEQEPDENVAVKSFPARTRFHVRHRLSGRPDRDHHGHSLFCRYSLK